MMKKHGIVMFLTLLVGACGGDAPMVHEMATTTQPNGHMSKPSVPIVVDVTHTVADGQITVTAKARVMTDVVNAQFEIFNPQEAEKVSGENFWTGNLDKDQEKTLTATYKLATAVTVYPLSWRALFSAQAGGLMMSMHGYTHYGNNTGSKALSVTGGSDGAKVRAGSLEYKGQ